MAGENLLKGEDSVLSIWDGVSAYIPIACLTSNSLSTTLSVLEANTKCDPGNTVRVANQFDYQISLDGHAIDTTVDTGKYSNTDLLTLQQAKTNVEWKMTTGHSSITYYGTAIITDLNTDLPNGDWTTFSATLIGTGAIVTTAPNP